MTQSDLTTRHVRILLVLANQPLHGWGISRAIEEATEGQIALRPGSLYRALHQLLERGMIRERNDPDEDPRRRMYELTVTGRHALTVELSSMGELIAQGRRVGVLGKRT